MTHWQTSTTSRDPDELGFYVDPVDPAPDVERRLVEFTAAVGARVVAQNRDGAQHFLGAVGRVRPLAGVCDVQRHCHHDTHI